MFFDLWEKLKLPAALLILAIKDFILKWFEYETITIFHQIL